MVRLSYEIPSETFEVNAIGTANVLDAVRQLNHSCSVVLITTDKVYHNNEWEYPYREDDRLGGYDPYSASKACAELVIDSYRNSFFNTSKIEVHGKALAVGRAGNVIGGGDWSKDRLIPDIVKSLHENNTISIRNPNAVRPWQHVIEPLSGYLILAEELYSRGSALAEPFNFGPRDEDCQSVESILNTINIIWKDCPGWKLDDEANPHEARFLKLDISKAKDKLNWTPKWNLGSTIKRIVDWNKISEGHPEYFAPDGVHLVPTGIAVYVDAILEELE